MVKQQNRDSYGIKRLESKNAKNAIIQKLATDFNLTPIIAEAYYSQVSHYFSEHSNIKLSSGEISYEGVSSEEPAGKHIRLTRKVTLVLKLMDINTDFEVLANFGLAGLRRHRLERITRQAYDQNALLSYEDIAMILTTSPATIKRDVALLKKQGKFIMTRGAKLDMGPGISHKTSIIELYFKGYTFTQIEQKTNHSELSVKRYLAEGNGKLLPTRGNIHDLSGAITHKREIITLYLQGYLTPDIAMKTNHSKEAVDRYNELPRCKQTEYQKSVS